MANTTSAEKRNRQSQKRRARNQSVRSTVKTAVKGFREAAGAKDLDAGKVKDALSSAIRTLGKAATKGVLHKRTAARRTSRLMKAANRATAQK